MNSDSLTIMNAISDMRAELLDQIGDVKSSVARLDGKLEGVKDTHDNFRNELLGEGGRIFNLENDQKTAANRQWIHTAAILPAMSLLRYIAHRIGLGI